MKLALCWSMKMVMAFTGSKLLVVLIIANWLVNLSWLGSKTFLELLVQNQFTWRSSDELRNPISVDNLRIDIGPGGSKKIKIGDRATFATRFMQNGPSLIGKALDDRLGVATLIEFVKHPPQNVELLAAFTVQEEIGLRGAKVAGYSMKPDLAFVIDLTPQMIFLFGMMRRMRVTMCALDMDQQFIVWMRAHFRIHD